MLKRDDNGLLSMLNFLLFCVIDFKGTMSSFARSTLECCRGVGDVEIPLQWWLISCNLDSKGTIPGLDMRSWLLASHKRLAMANESELAFYLAYYLWRLASNQYSSLVLAKAYFLLFCFFPLALIPKANNEGVSFEKRECTYLYLSVVGSSNVGSREFLRIDCFQLSCLVFLYHFSIHKVNILAWMWMGCGWPCFK